MGRARAIPSPFFSGRSDCMVFFDEIYADLAWDVPHGVWSPLQDKAFMESGRVVVFRGFSKNLGCQSWRLGYAVTTTELAEDIVT